MNRLAEIAVLEARLSTVSDAATRRALLARIRALATEHARTLTPGSDAAHDFAQEYLV